MSSKTIVTACDRNFIWGTWLLLLSLRRSGISVPVHVMAHNLTPVERAILQQVDGVVLFDAPDDANHRHIVYQKTAAILTADTDLVMWIDSDCIVTGDITSLIETPHNGLQIRVRPPKEIAYLFRRRYRRGECRGTLPARVLDIWRADIGGRSEPALNTSCNAHCFVVHHSQFGFLRQWEAQIRKVIPNENGAGVMDDRSFSYFLLDEAVLSSMLAFSDNAPPLEPYRLESNPARCVVHFGGKPKPWDCWLLRNMKYFDEVIGLLDWGEEQGWSLPGRPGHLKKRFKGVCRILACFLELKRYLWRTIRAIKKKTYL